MGGGQPLVFCADKAGRKRICGPRMPAYHEFARRNLRHNGQSPAESDWRPASGKESGVAARAVQGVPIPGTSPARGSRHQSMTPGLLARGTLAVSHVPIVLWAGAKRGQLETMFFGNRFHRMHALR